MKLEEQVLNWAHEKGILELGDPDSQVDKTREEVEELQDALLDMGINPTPENTLEAMIERGDIEVTLIILDHLTGFDRDKCLELALKKIQGRTGKMINGQFVKEEDL